MRADEGIGPYVSKSPRRAEGVSRRLRRVSRGNWFPLVGAAVIPAFPAGNARAVEKHFQNK